MEADVEFEVIDRRGQVVTGHLRRIETPTTSLVLVIPRDAERARRLEEGFIDLFPQLVRTHWLIVPFTFIECLVTESPTGLMIESFTRVSFVWDDTDDHPLAPGVGRFYPLFRYVITRAEIEAIICSELAPLPRERLRVSPAGSR